MRTLKSVICLAALLMNISCGNGDRSANSLLTNSPVGAPPPSVSPPTQAPYADQSWHFIATSSNSQPPTLEASFVFEGSSVRGIAHAALDTISGTCFHFDDDIPITGSADAGNKVRFAGTVDAGYGGTLTIDGTLSEDRSSLVDGSYQITKGCADGYSGTIAAAKVNSVEGHYGGTLSKGNITIPVTADLMQAKLADPISGYFWISGTLTMNGSTCAGTFSLSGSAIGNYIKLFSSSGTGLEGLTGKVDPTANQIALSDYPYSDDCIAGYEGVLQHQ